MRRWLGLLIGVSALFALLGIPAALAQGGNIYAVPSPVACIVPVVTATPVALPACAEIDPAPVIALYDLGFAPDAFTIPAGVPVTITLHNAGVALHNLTVPGLDIWQDVLPGETKQVTVTAEVGDYPFFCDVPMHKAGGMVGLLRVRPAE